MKANLAQKPSGGDRETARDVAAGKCDIGIGNTYYWPLMMNNPAQKAWAEATKVILPTFEGGGTHVNVSGVMLAKHAPNKANAIKLIEWLAGEKAQHMYADSNFEYPLRAGVAINPIIAGYGTLKPDALPLAKIADQQEGGSRAWWTRSASTIELSRGSFMRKPDGGSAQRGAVASLLGHASSRQRSPIAAGRRRIGGGCRSLSLAAHGRGRRCRDRGRTLQRYVLPRGERCRPCCCSRGVAIVTAIAGTGPAWLVTDLPASRARHAALAAAAAAGDPDLHRGLCLCGYPRRRRPGAERAARACPAGAPRDYWFPPIRSLGGAIFIIGLVLYPYVYLAARAMFQTPSRHVHRRRAHARRPALAR